MFVAIKPNTIIRSSSNFGKICPVNKMFKLVYTLFVLSDFGKTLNEIFLSGYINDIVLVLWKVVATECVF